LWTTDTDEDNDELNKALKTHMSTPYDHMASQPSSHNNRTNVFAPGFINKVLHTENKVHTFGEISSKYLETEGKLYSKIEYT